MLSRESVDVSSVLKYEFVVRNPNHGSHRTLPANPSPNQFDGIVTFAFKVPLQASAADDPYSISAIFLAVDDSQVRVADLAVTRLSAFK